MTGHRSFQQPEYLLQDPSLISVRSCRWCGAITAISCSFLVILFSEAYFIFCFLLFISGLVGEIAATEAVQR